MTADPYARLDAVYLLGALDADERLAYEAHLTICRRCRAGLAEISVIPPLLAGLHESVFAAPPEVAPTPVPDWGARFLPDCGSLVGPWPVAWPRHMRICVRGGTRRAR
jgi:anti-sigma factor RsiW